MRPAEDRPWPRPAVMRHTARPLGNYPSSAAMTEGKQGGTPPRNSQKRQNVTKRANGVEQLGGFRLRGARSNQTTRPAKSKLMTTPGEKTLGKTGKKSTVLNPERELEDPSHMGTLIVSSRDSATGSDSNPPSGPEEQEKLTSRVTACTSDGAQHERCE